MWCGHWADVRGAGQVAEWACWTSRQFAALAGSGLTHGQAELEGVVWAATPTEAVSTTVPEPDLRACRLLAPW